MPPLCLPSHSVLPGELRHTLPRPLPSHCLLLCQPVWMHGSLLFAILICNQVLLLYTQNMWKDGSFRCDVQGLRQLRICNNIGPSLQHNLSIQIFYSKSQTPLAIFPSGSQILSRRCMLTVKCVSFRDVLPFTLELPEAIARASSHKQLESISHMGVGM